MEWYLVVLKKYAEFNGRARRKEFWMFILINLIISIVFNILASIASFFSIIGLLYSLAVLVPNIAVGVRRMHDTGRPGWWIIIPIINIIYACEDSKPGPNQYGPNPKGL